MWWKVVSDSWVLLLIGRELVRVPPLPGSSRTHSGPSARWRHYLVFLLWNRRKWNNYSFWIYVNEMPERILGFCTVQPQHETASVCTKHCHKHQHNNLHPWVTATYFRQRRIVCCTSLTPPTHTHTHTCCYRWTFIIPRREKTELLFTVM